MIEQSESWALGRRSGTAAELHQWSPPWVRGVWRLTPSRPTIVLGSTQPDGDVDVGRAASLGLDVVRRRSGGGAVFLSDDSVWIDVVIPRSDPLWRDDVAVSGLWLGDAWVGVLRSHGLAGVETHRGSMVHHRLDRTICFAGLAPGEVTDGSGAKVLGVSQRRTRDGARLQCVLYRRWRPEEWSAAFTNDEVRLTLDQLAVRTVGSASAGEGLAEQLLDVLVDRH